MPAYYLDTSAVVKRYATEAGTAWVTALIDPAGSHTLYTVRLTGPEMVAALGRKERTGELTQAEAMGAIAAFRRAWPCSPIRSSGPKPGGRRRPYGSLLRGGAEQPH